MLVSFLSLAVNFSIAVYHGHSMVSSVLLGGVQTKGWKQLGTVLSLSYLQPKNVGTPEQMAVSLLPEKL